MDCSGPPLIIRALKLLLPPPQATTLVWKNSMNDSSGGEVLQQ